jgi:hypothetical protein
MSRVSILYFPLLDTRHMIDTGTHIYVNASSKSFMISLKFLVSFFRNNDRTSMPLTSIPSWINNLIASINRSLELLPHKKWSALFPLLSFSLTLIPSWINNLIASINLSLELLNRHSKWSALFPLLSFLFTSTPCRINVFNFSFWFVQGKIMEVAGCLILHSSNSSFSFSASYIESN